MHTNIRVLSYRAVLTASAAFFAICFLFETAFGSTLTIDKSNSAPPSGVQSGVPFTYTIGYSWSGGVPASGTLIVQDVVPAPLIIQSTSPSGPGVVITGNTVTETVSGISLTAGSGVLQITVYFPFGTTCNRSGVCDTARIKEFGAKTWDTVSNASCVTALATNNWQFQNTLYAGCACGTGNDVIFRVLLENPYVGGPYGSLAMTSATLNYSFPAASGATITDVTMGGSIVGNCTYGWDATISPSNTATITLCPASAPWSVWNYWTVFYIHVSFPCSDSNQTIPGIASWSYSDTCLAQLSFKDTATVKICKPVSQGSLYKYFYETTYLPNNPFFYPNTITPGCCGTYGLQYGNTGTVSQDSVIMTDTVSGDMDANSIYTDLSGFSPSPTPSVKEEVWTYPSGPWHTIQSARSVSGSDAIPPADMPVGKIRWTYTGSLPIAAYIQNTIAVCVRDTNFRTGLLVSAGQLIKDTVAVKTSGGVNDIYICIDTVSAAAPHLVAEKSFVGSCTGGPSGPWYPGSIVRYEIAVANLGNATATLNTITDHLPPGFTYVGNPTYFWGSLTPPNSWLYPSSPPCDSFHATVPSEIGSLTSSPLLGATTLVWKFPTLPAQCDGTPEFFIIQFDVLIDSVPPTLPGTYGNAFTDSASNATSVLSDSAYVVVSSIVKVTAIKQVRSGSSGPWGSSATIPPGGTGQYLLTVTNTGNESLSNLCILDILPHVGDIGVLPPYAIRNSAFDLPLMSSLSVPVGFTATYYPGYTGNLNLPGTVNPMRSGVCGGFCGVGEPSGATAGTWSASLPAYYTYAFSVSAGSSTTLAPGASLQVIVPFTVPTNAKLDSTACNSFAYQCNPTGLPATCLAAEPTDVCVTVGAPTGCEQYVGTGTLDSSCCQYNFAIDSGIGFISALHYTVTGATIESISTNPCVPSSTVPASLFGSTSGTLHFSPVCTHTMNFAVQATPTTASGEVCIDWSVVYQKPGTQTFDTCTFTTCYTCDREPESGCDTVTVVPYPYNQTEYDYLRFTITNHKIPKSTICWVDISYSPTPGSIGGGVPTFSTPQTITSPPLGIPQFSYPYTRIPSTVPPSISPYGGNPGCTLAPGVPYGGNLQFNIGVNYTIGWTGTIRFAVHYCDGDSCIYTYGPWTPKPPSPPCPNCVVITNESLSSVKLYAWRFRVINPEQENPVGYLSLQTDNAGDAIFAGSGKTLAGQKDSTAQTLNAYEQGLQSCLFTFDNPIGIRDTSGYLDIVVAHDSTVPGPPVIKWITYDTAGNPLLTDTTSFKGGTSVVGETNRMGGSPGFGILSIIPNPSNGQTEVNYVNGEPTHIRMDIYNDLGTAVQSIDEGFTAAGTHSISFDTRNLPSGKYYCRLSSDSDANSAPLVIVK